VCAPSHSPCEASCALPATRRVRHRVRSQPLAVLSVEMQFQKLLARCLEFHTQPPIARNSYPDFRSQRGVDGSSSVETAPSSLRVCLSARQSFTVTDTEPTNARSASCLFRRTRHWSPVRAAASRHPHQHSCVMFERLRIKKRVRRQSTVTGCS